MNHSRIVITATVLFSLLAASQTHAALTPKLEWVQTYGPLYGNEGRDVAVDGVGNIYATGRSGNDIWTRKYNSDGSIVWTDIYASPGASWDMGRGISLDAAGNSYVTGYEYRGDLGEQWNIWLRKYDSAGNVLWTRTYDSPGNPDNDGAVGVDVSMTGEVYIVGYEGRYDLGQDWNVWLRKYNANGNTLWTRTYNSPAHSIDAGHAVALDSESNVYVIGNEYRTDLGEGYNIWLRKYDANGDTLWTKTYDSPAHDCDSGWGVAVDNTGNVYATGYEKRDDLGQSYNIWLRKYDTNGNALWTKTYDSPAHDSDAAYDVTVDSEGNIYVTGFETRGDIGQGNNIWLRKYNANGNVLWTQTYDSATHNSDSGHGVAVDSSNNVIVIGTSASNIVLLKYAQVPEPSTLLLLAPALLGFAGVLRRKLR